MCTIYGVLTFHKPELKMCTIYGVFTFLIPEPQTPEDTLEQAQLNKLDRILDQAGVTAGQRVLEIGCGWGSCMERGVVERGCNWVGLTISTEQLKWATERAQRLGVADKVR